MVMIRVEYPLFMKMVMISDVDVLPEHGIDQIRELILNDVWDKFGSAFGVERHGSAHQVEIMQNNTKIENTEEMRKCMKLCQDFQVIFQHP